MLDTKAQVVAALTDILPTYYEIYVDGNTATPCITYFEYNNVQDKTGDTLGYSEITYCIKIWDKVNGTWIAKSLLVDEAMRELGFRRISANEQTDNNLVCKVMLYKCLGLENIGD